MVLVGLALGSRDGGHDIVHLTGMSANISQAVSVPIPLTSSSPHPPSYSMKSMADERESPSSSRVKMITDGPKTSQAQLSSCFGGIYECQSPRCTMLAWFSNEVYRIPDFTFPARYYRTSGLADGT